MPKILAVDDSATMRRVLELTFSGLEGFEVVSFDSGDAALSHAQSQGGDLLIADASMSPDGYDLCQRFKGNGATGGISVLILGSQHTPIDADKAKGAGADDTALKPYDTNTFIEKVKGLIAKGGARAPAAQVATYRQAPAAVAAPAAAAAPKKPTLELADDDEPVLTV
ncbi:MAG: response regulator, partial [Deltaproteobacteria bacterium]|nr:response regulator [Deltaproteobacteria bacterium]